MSDDRIVAYGEVLVFAFGVTFAFLTAIRLASATDCTGKRARQKDILTLQRTSDALQKLFNANNPRRGVLRNVDLAVTDRLGWLKSRLVQYARQ